MEEVPDDGVVKSGSCSGVKDAAEGGDEGFQFIHSCRWRRIARGRFRWAEVH